MNKKQLLKYLVKDTYTRLKASPIEGVGVYAIKDIPANINPFRESGQEFIKFTKDELTDLPSGVREMIKDYCVEEEGVVWISDSGFDPIEISYFLNHSKNPNLKTLDGETFITLRPVGEGEELCVNYKTYSKDYLEEKGY